MTMMVGCASRLGVVIGTLVLILLLGVASPVLAGCSVAGNFTFTSTGGFGLLSLAADGKVIMGFVPGHDICPTCLFAGRSVDGTYRTLATDGGCMFTMDVSGGGRKDTIAGAVAFEGRVLLFIASTSPDYGNGLALRNDVLTGQ
ncbi:MAG TPA: hypothetical protein VK548_01845 [Candidatus Acidoferrum sp.]|nr:hypothetical protein [Candidatus Acidoferrum sp.]